MKLPPDKLKKICTSLTGFNKSSAITKGEIPVLVTIG